MTEVVVFRIKTLHARSMQETGLLLRHRDNEFYSGPIVACLDEMAAAPGNLGVVDFSTGAIKFHWCTLVTMPFLADAFAENYLPVSEAAPLRVSFEEEGMVVGDGFVAQGPGWVHDGSIFSHAVVASVNNVGGGGGGGDAGPPSPPPEITTDKQSTQLAWPSAELPLVPGVEPADIMSFRERLFRGNMLQVFTPEMSKVSITLPEALGGGRQYINLRGAFTIDPVLVLGARARMASDLELRMTVPVT
jgi:hypothetical protein